MRQGPDNPGVPGVHTETESGDDALVEDLGHPRGTLVIVAIFGLLFGVAWFVTYFFVFLERGAPHLHP